MNLNDYSSESSNNEKQKVMLTGVYDKNGNPIKGAFIELSDEKKKELENKHNNQIQQQFQNNNAMNMTPNYQNFQQMNTQQQMINQQQMNNISNSNQNPNRGLFLGGLVDAVGGGGAAGGLLAGGAALGAGAAAGAARKEKFYFDKTKLELKLNFYDFQKDFIDYEYTELRNIIRETSKLNGGLSAMSKNLVYLINNRILDIITMTDKML